MTRAGIFFTILAGPLALAGCASPDPALYTLAAQPGTEIPPAAARSKPHSVELRRIGLAGYLDRPGIVRAASAYRLDMAPDARWAAPFGQMLERVIAEDLELRLPGVSVVTESGGIPTQSDRVLKLDIQRLDADPAGDMVLTGQAALLDASGAHPTIRSFRIMRRPASPATEDQVAAMSATVAGLADDLARMLR